MGDVLAVGGEAVPVFLVPLLDVATGVEAEATTLDEVAVGTPVGSTTGVDVVVVKGLVVGRGDRREKGVVVRFHPGAPAPELSTGQAGSSSDARSGVSRSA